MGGGGLDLRLRGGVHAARQSLIEHLSIILLPLGYGGRRQGEGNEYGAGNSWRAPVVPRTAEGRGKQQAHRPRREISSSPWEHG